IRDFHVTGVQTCALPILAASRGDRIRKAREMRGETRDQVAAATGVYPKTIARIERGEVTNSPKATILEDYLGITPRLAATEPPRSEERRVGKEGRSRWAT